MTPARAIEAPPFARGSTLLISDLHLAAAAPRVLDRFEAFLADQAPAADALYILGDLFDAWAGDDDLDDPFNARVVAALARLSGRGVALYFMPGNRDFLVGDAFAAAAGLTLLPDPHRADIHGMPTLLTHGDALCVDDADYQRFRAEVRAPAWRAAFLARPLAERKREIAALRAASATEKQRKSMASMDAHPDAVAAALRAHGAQAMAHGHTHRPGRHAHDVDGRTCLRWVLGDWDVARGDILVCAPTGWKLRAADSSHGA